VNLDNLRDMRLRGEKQLSTEWYDEPHHEVSQSYFVYLSLCGSLQDDFGNLWVKPEGDFRAIYNLIPVVVYLKNQQDRAVDVMKEVCNNHPYQETAYWWCLNTGFTGCISPSLKIGYDIFADGRQAQVREALA